MIEFASVCSGIEAASVAWHPLGWRAAWLSEIDRNASGLLAHHYPNTPNYGDMTTLAPRIRAGEIAAPPLLVGGTPCQSYSIAGARQGLADPRGALTMHYVDILNALDERRAAAGEGPALCLWENVPGVLNDKTNAFGNFLAALAGAGRAYDPPDGRRWSVAGCVFGPRRIVAWRVLDAQYFSLAQRRKRVFVVAGTRPGPDPREILFECEGVRRDTPPSRQSWEDVAGTAGGSFAFGGGRTGGPVDVAACLTARGQRIDFEVETFALSVALRGRDGGAMAELGDGVAGCLRASTGGGDKPHVLIGRKESGGQNEKDAPEILRTLREQTGAEAFTERGPGVFNPLQPPKVLRPDVYGKRFRRASGETGSKLVNCASSREETGSGRGVLEMWGEKRQRRSPSRPRLAEQRPGEPGEIVPKVPRCGASNSKSVCDLRNRDEGPRAVQQTLVAASEVGESFRNKKEPALPRFAVRRLTPSEVERLMGFPEGYTDAPRGNRPAADGTRYKELGNSKAVPVVRWIGERIQKCLT